MQEELVELEQGLTAVPHRRPCLGPALSRLATSADGKLAVVSSADAVGIVDLQPAFLRGFLELPKVWLTAA